jgi:Skp family chaperone for outer membrane proteins
MNNNELNIAFPDLGNNPTNEEILAYVQLIAGVVSSPVFTAHQKGETLRKAQAQMIPHEIRTSLLEMRAFMTERFGALQQQQNTFQQQQNTFQQQHNTFQQQQSTFQQQLNTFQQQLNTIHDQVHVNSVQLANVPIASRNARRRQEESFYWLYRDLRQGERFVNLASLLPPGFAEFCETTEFYQLDREQLNGLCHHYSLPLRGSLEHKRHRILAHLSITLLPAV